MAGAIAMVPQLRTASWSPTGLVHVGATTRLAAVARRADHDFRLVRGVGYDGQFYWAVGLDPGATGSLTRAFDKATYRFGHPLLGWLAAGVAGGAPAALAPALLALELASLAAAAFGAAALAADAGRSGWLGLWVALSPGLVGAAALDLAEPLAAAVLLWALRAFVARRRYLAGVLLSVAPLAKEPLLLVVLALVGWLLVVRRRREAVFYALTLGPAVAWWTYLRAHLGAWFTTGSTALAAPFAGWWSSLALDRTHRLDAVEVLVLASVLAAIAFGAVIAMRRPGPLSFAYLGLSFVAVCLAGNATASFTTALRTTALPLALLPFVALKQGGLSAAT